MSLQDQLALALHAIKTAAEADIAAARRLEADASARVHNAALDAMTAVGTAMGDAAERTRLARLDAHNALSRQRESVLSNLAETMARFAAERQSAASAYETARRQETAAFLAPPPPEDIVSPPCSKEDADRVADLLGIPARIGDVILDPARAVEPSSCERPPVEDGTAQEVEGPREGATPAEWPEDPAYDAALAALTGDAEEEAEEAERLAQVAADDDSRHRENCREQEADEDGTAPLASPFAPEEVVLAANAPEEVVITFTDAPTEYDGFGTVTVEADCGLAPSGKTARKVTTPARHAQWQRDRYESGGYLACEEGFLRGYQDSAARRAAPKPAKARKPRKKS